MNWNTNRSPSRLEAWIPSLTIGFLSLLMIQVGAYVIGAWPAMDGTLTGPDSYMRLNRVTECIGGLACSDGVVSRSNAPFGEALHWPWLWDRIILGISAPLQLFLPLRTSVTVAAYLSGPLLGGLTLLLLTFAARRACVGLGLPFVGLLMVTQPHVNFLFSYARPDHHAIQAAVYAAALLATLTTLATRSHWAARCFGAAFGVSVWLSTEGLITGLPLLVALGLLWMIAGGTAEARLNRDAALWAAGTSALALAIDAPLAGLVSVEFDRISIVHLVLFGLMAAFWGVTARGSTPESPTGRVVWVLVGAGTAFVLLEMLFPGFRRGPAADMAEPLWTLWLEHTAEYVPLVERSDVTQVLMSAVPAFVAIPLSLWAARATTGSRRAVWYAVAFTLTWFQLLATFQQVRWSTYVHLIATLPLAWLLGGMLRKVDALAPPRLSSSLRITSVCLVALGPVLLAAAGGLAAGRSDYTVIDRCEPSRIIDSLSDLQGADGGPATILTPIFWGPEILWRTRQRVVATPYHRNTAGIMDSHRIMIAPPDEARDRLTTRGITHIAICSELPWLPYVDAEESPNSLYAVLVSGQLPDWVKSMPLSEQVDGLRLFAVEAQPRIRQ